MFQDNIPYIDRIVRKAMILGNISNPNSYDIETRYIPLGIETYKSEISLGKKVILTAETEVAPLSVTTLDVKLTRIVNGERLKKSFSFPSGFLD